MSLAAFLLSLLALAAAPPPALSTISERSGFKKTGRYEEVVQLCADFEKAYPGKVRCLKFGVTPEGRPMMALAASLDGVLDPASVREKKRPVVLFQGGIHAGEIDGKDAGFLALRELLDGKVAAGALAKVTAVFVPVFNIDGHERFGPNHRPNQIGPEEAGWRVTGQNLNLNRDYAKSDSAEMTALLKLLNEWDPIVYLDLHVTDGAQFQHDVSVIFEPQHVGPAKLAEEGRALQAELMATLTRQGHLPLGFYPEFMKHDDPTSGAAIGVAPPRFSASYWMHHNRFGVLVETHSWKDYKARVKATYDTVIGFIALAAKDGPRWLTAAALADEEACKLGGTTVALAWEHTEKTTPFPFKGYAYVREPSAVSGKLWTRYDPTKPQIWNIPLRDELRVSLSAVAPVAGYLIPAAWAGLMGEKLATHGIAFETLAAPATLEVEGFRATDVKAREGSYEGRQVMTFKGGWAKEKQTLVAGSLFVPIAQPKSHLLMELLEPLAPDSFAAWGTFNAAFEQREYIEDYVIEGWARELLAQDARVRAEFDQRLANDADFAKDPTARLDFFYRRHPAFDARFRLYPILRVAAHP